MSNLSRIGLFAVLVAGFFAYDWYDRKFNYLPVVATITNASTVCYFQKKEYKTTTTSGEFPCALTAQMSADERWQGFQVKEKTHIGYSYEIEGKKFSGKGTREDAAAKSLSVGSHLDVLANIADLSKSRW